MDTFSNYHPLVNFIYFSFIFLFTMFHMHPILLIISLIGAFSYSIYLKGIKGLRFNLALLFPTMLMTALINPAFNHEGITILTYLPSGNPLTLESIVYGLAAAIMLSSIIMWFVAFNEIMTSDKFVYLFGRIIPSLSLVLSMALRFVPRFKDQIKKVSDTQKTLGRDISSGNLIRRAKIGLTILSIMISWALESSIETADSMKSRGYGLPGRSAFSIYKFEKRDLIVLIIMLVVVGYLLIGWKFGALSWRYFPNMKGSDINFYFLSLSLSYLFLVFLPIIINLEEEKQWKHTQLET